MTMINYIKQVFFMMLLSASCLASAVNEPQYGAFSDAIDPSNQSSQDPQGAPPAYSEVDPSSGAVAQSDAGQQAATEPEIASGSSWMGRMKSYVRRFKNHAKMNFMRTLGARAKSYGYGAIAVGALGIGGHIALGVPLESTLKCLPVIIASSEAINAATGKSLSETHIAVGATHYLAYLFGSMRISR